MSIDIEENLRRALHDDDGPQGWPEPVRRVEAGIQRRLSRRRATAALAVIVVATIAAPVAFVSAGWRPGWDAVSQTSPEGLTQPDTGPWMPAVAGSILACAVGLWLANRRVPAGAVTRFGQRYGLAEPVGTSVAVYLAIRRRWLVLGTTAALVTELLDSRPGSIEVRWAVLGLGLLAGAMAGELRSRIVTGPARALRQPIPGLLTATLTGALLLSVVTVLGVPRLAEVTPAAAGVWAGAAAGVTVATWAVMLIAAARPLGGGAREAKAVTASGLHMLTAVGVATALLCLSYALQLTSRQLLNATAQAIDTLGWVAGFAALILASVTGRAARSRDRHAVVGSPSRQVAFVSVVALLGSAIALTAAIISDRPPFPASAVNPRVTIVVSDWEHRAEVAQLLGTTGEQPEIVGDRVLYGRLDLDRPPTTGELYYELILIDKARNLPLRNVFGPDGSWWGSQLHQVPRQYPWLSALAADQGSAVGVRADRRGPINFTAGLPPGEPASAEGLLAVLILSSTDHIYWATEVPVTVLELPG